MRLCLPWLRHAARTSSSTTAPVTLAEEAAYPADGGAALEGAAAAGSRGALAEEIGAQEGGWDWVADFANGGAVVCGGRRVWYWLRSGLRSATVAETEDGGGAEEEAGQETGKEAG